jgi:hypothetical protein
MVLCLVVGQLSTLTDVLVLIEGKSNCDHQGRLSISDFNSDSLLVEIAYNHDTELLLSNLT